MDHLRVRRRSDRARIRFRYCSGGEGESECMGEMYDAVKVGGSQRAILHARRKSKHHVIGN